MTEIREQISSSLEASSPYLMGGATTVVGLQAVGELIEDGAATRFLRPLLNHGSLLTGAKVMQAVGHRASLFASVAMIGSYLQMGKTLEKILKRPRECDETDLSVAVGAGLVMINLATQVFLPSAVGVRSFTFFAGLLLDVGTSAHSILQDKSWSNLALQIATLVVFNGRRAERREMIDFFRGKRVEGRPVPARSRQGQAIPAGIMFSVAPGIEGGIAAARRLYARVMRTRPGTEQREIELGYLRSHDPDRLVEIAAEGDEVAYGYLERLARDKNEKACLGLGKLAAGGDPQASGALEGLIQRGYRPAANALSHAASEHRYPLAVFLALLKEGNPLIQSQARKLDTTVARRVAEAAPGLYESWQPLLELVEAGNGEAVMDVRDIFRLHDPPHADVNLVNPAARVIFSQIDARKNPIGREAWRDPDAMIALDEWADYNHGAWELIRSLPLDELIRKIERKCDPMAVEAFCRVYVRAPGNALRVMDRIDLSRWRGAALKNPKRITIIGQLAEMGHLEASVILLDLAEGTGAASEAAHDFVIHAGLMDLLGRAKLDRQAFVVYQRYLSSRGVEGSETLPPMVATPMSN